MSDAVMVRTDRRGPTFHRYVHGESIAGSRTKEYRVWSHIKGRCRNPRDAAFHLYGGRGITMCEEWASSFEAFVSAVGRAPSPTHSLDRIDNNGNYEPGNLRWATPAQQSRNTRRTIMLNGVPLVDYCEAEGLSYGAVSARIRRGDPIAIATSKLSGGAYRKLLKEGSSHD